MTILTMYLIVALQSMKVSLERFLMGKNWYINAHQ